MNRAGALTLAGLALGAGLATGALAQSIHDARIETRRAADPAPVIAGLGRGPEWVAWSVAGTPEAANVCCFGLDDGRDRGCSLAGRERGWGTSNRWRDPAAPRELRIFVEIDGGRPVRLLAVGARCPIDGAGRALVEIAGVEPERSLDLVERWTRDTKNPRDVRESALAALAYHAAPSAAERLASLGRTGDLERRGQALFWLAQTQDPRAAAWIGDVISHDADRKLREQAVFALSQLDDAAPRLTNILRTTRFADVRRQALFWLAQSDDPRALDELDAILNR